MKALTFNKPAAKALRKLPAPMQQRIVAALVRYAKTGHGNVTTLAAAEGARLRVGDYRAIFSENETEITVLGVGHRKEIYR